MKCACRVFNYVVAKYYHSWHQRFNVSNEELVVPSVSKKKPLLVLVLGEARPLSSQVPSQEDVF